MALGGRLADFLYQGRFDVLLVNGRNTLAETAEPRLDMLPDVRLLRGYLEIALCEHRKGGDVPLHRLSIDALALDEDRRPMNVLLSATAIGRALSFARPPSDIHDVRSV